MPLVSRFFILLGLLTFYLLLGTSFVFAQADFSTSYDATYDVAENGITQVTQKVSLKNLTSQFFASNFTLSIGSTTVTEALASDASGALEVKSETKDNKTNINIKLNQQVAGLGKLQSFTLRFKSKDFAQKIGNAWEVNLPKIPTPTNLESYNLVLSVPASFEDPTSIHPAPKSVSASANKLLFIYTLDELKKGGVSANFGSSQVFDFKLNYKLKNKALFPVLTNITVPADTEYQDIIISKIEPLPLNVTVDEDGNYLAWYKLRSRSEVDVKITGSAKLLVLPKKKIPSKLSSSKIQEYTKEAKFWPKNNPLIKTKVAEIFKDVVNVSNEEKARLVYQFVVDTLRYDSERLKSADIQRLDGVTALNNPDKALCMEFTDLFITLARAAGVPSRELNGFAYSQNKSLRPSSMKKDLLHAWPEYFDEKRGWVMVDPTWENTSGGVDYFNKFDLNHLVLVIKGKSSEGPVTSDNVEVELSESDFLGKPQVDVSIKISNKIWAGLPSIAEVKITNNGNFATDLTNLTVSSDKIIILGQRQYALRPIPPLGYVNPKFNLRTNSVFEKFTDEFVVTVGGQRYSKKVEVNPFFLFAKQSSFASFVNFPFFLLLPIALILGIYGSVLGIHIYLKRPRIKLGSNIKNAKQRKPKAKIKS